LLLIVWLSVTVVIGGIINFNIIRTSDYQVVIPRKSSDISRLRIAFVSDFHLKENTPARFVEKFVREIETINPDLMLYGGDIVEGDRQNEKMEYFEDLLSGIKARLGVYGVLGNHEHYARQDRGDFFSNSGIEVLNDTFVVAGNSIVVAGRNDSHVRTRKSAEELMKVVPDSLPIILLDHRPTEMEQISKTPADIVFSGHTHDGQLFPINLITRSVYELSHGYMKKGSTHFFVSSGIRLWGPPVRTTGKSEIMVVDVALHSILPLSPPKLNTH
jgi:predicted MPP superfamily phosphohydrolase